VLSELFAELGRMGLRDTLIVVNSDHGEGFGEIDPDDLFHGGHVYDSTIWVPFILYHPALEARPRRIADVVESVDMLPTVLDLLGVPVAPDSVAGRSLAEAVRGGAMPPPRSFDVVETLFPNARKSGLLKGDWKLVVDYDFPDRLGLQLFHFGDGPGESLNLAAKRPRRVERMLALLDDWQRAQPEVGSALPRKTTSGEREALRALGYVE
jgi:arylsulfatase A-like enzyme